MRIETIIFLMMPLLCNAQLGARFKFPGNDLYQYNYITVSPAFAGTDGQKISFFGSVYAYKNTEYDGSGFVGYEARIDKFHSGVGFNLSNNTYVNRTFSDLNFMYNYQWNIAEERTLIFGAKLTSSQMVIDFSAITPLNPYDPLIDPVITANARQTLGGVGVLYKHRNVFAGFSIDNLVRGKARLDNLYLVSGYDDRIYNLVLGRSSRVWKQSSLTQSVYVMNRDKYWRFDFNNSILINDRFIAGFSLAVNNSDSDNEYDPKVNAGIKVNDKAQFVISLYSEAYNAGNKKFSGQLMMMFGL